ncbi:hypothetical protein Enr13x_17600 [Stieleria neptunia]|uniref:Uncharacterized protein n=1 Tax=Stieleria neptunia TaxID=2527979 RepID=A0A518HMB4_9BACT|nr:hypothetical protein Enr13x_17600 [Stieleria neptunia]
MKSIAWVVALIPILIHAPAADGRGPQPGDL